MRPLCLLALAALLSFGSARAAAVYAPASTDNFENHTDQGADSLVPPGEEANAVVALVTGIDRQHGIVSLETEIGPIVTLAAPEDLQNLHTGDLLVLYVVDEDPKQNLGEDPIVT